MKLELELSNYRCFTRERPAVLRLGEGPIALIGANNAGKSTVMRFLVEFRELLQVLAQHTGNREQAFSGVQQQITPQHVLEPSEVFSRVSDGDLTIQIRRLDLAGFEHADALQATVKRPAGGVPLYFTAQAIKDGRVIDGVLNAPEAGWIQPEDGPPVNLGPHFEAAAMLADSLYLPAFRNASQTGSQGPYYDISVGEAFVQTWDQFKTGVPRQNNVVAAEVMKEIKRILGFEEFDVNADPERRNLQVLVNGRSFGLHELGGGTAQLIVALIYAATRKPQILGIDEPELNLHPALQVDFLNTLSTYAQSGVVLFATHNLGLARSVATTIYSVRTIAPGQSELVNFDADARGEELLGELSFRAFQGLGVEQLLLVEGPTDLRVVQRWLRLYRAEHKVVLVPLGGRESINGRAEAMLSELTRAAPAVAAIIDSERRSADADPEHEVTEFAEACENVGVKCHLTDYRAIENYFPESAVRAVVGPGGRALAPYESLRDAGSRGWAKRDNSKIAAAMTKGDLAGTDIDAFLATLADPALPDPVRASDPTAD